MENKSSKAALIYELSKKAMLLCFDCAQQNKFTDSSVEKLLREIIQARKTLTVEIQWKKNDLRYASKSQRLSPFLSYHYFWLTW